MVNRDLTRRVKQCSGVAWAQKAVQSDVAVVHRLIQILDKKNKLWEHAQVQPATGEGTEMEEKEVCLLLSSDVVYKHQPTLHDSLHCAVTLLHVPITVYQHMVVACILLHVHVYFSQLIACIHVTVLSI